MVVASSSHRSKPPRLLKGGTATTKSHRFETFSQRVSKLKIDPVHRVRRNSFSESDGHEGSSYFRASLEHWMELNLSENFTQFTQKVLRLCESLPQLLHHQDKIVKLLMDYISKKDELCLEPLLSLMAQFARDLGAKFERHFQSAVALVSSVAATHPNVEVIEWSFTCLAWIFKFLSRLLVPDLRPLLAIMTQYLGKQQQKYFVTRFAAESISFLIRKAAAVYYKDKAPLERAVKFLFEDLRQASEEGRRVPEYQEGLMAMFADAIKGVKNGIHSNGIDILSCLINAVDVTNEDQNSLSEFVLNGVLINLVHHCNAVTFAPVQDAVCGFAEVSTSDESSVVKRVKCSTLFLCVATRKGTRIRDWKRIHGVSLILLQQATENNDFPVMSIERLLGAVAASVQYSPMDDLLSSMRQIMEAVTSPGLSPHFISFCNSVAKLSQERFHSVVHPYLQRFIISLWQDYEEGLLVLLPKLCSTGRVTSEQNKAGYLHCPNSWKKTISSAFSKPQLSETDMVLLNAYSRITEAIDISNSPSILSDVCQRLYQNITSSLKSNSPDGTDARFFLGQGLLTYVKLSTQLNQLDPQLWPLLCSRGFHYTTFPVFLEAISAYVSALPQRPEITEEELDKFADALLSNLSNSSHELRLQSLKILQSIFSWLKMDTACLSLAIGIETSDLSFQNSRAISMEIRRLGMSYATASRVKWLDRLIPNFCFGLLTKKMASIWDDVCEAMKTICETEVGERLVSELSMAWLQSSQLQVDSAVASAETQKPVTTEFECFNVLNIEQSVHSSFSMVENAKSILTQDFESSHTPLNKPPMNARSQALKVLNAVPRVAEKKSRLIVPLFLSWALHDDVPADFNPEEENKDAADPSEGERGWSMQDKKAMLTLFGKFTNPKVIFKSSEVHDVLLDFLCNGDLEIQRLALKAIFMWKFRYVQPYEENLLNIVDDGRFKDELAVLVNVGKDNSVIENEHIEDLFPYLLRLLYGKMVARAGSKGSLGRQEGRRKAILRTISQLPESELAQFVRISFGPLYGIEPLQQDGVAEHVNTSWDIMSPRKQLGLLNMIETMLSVLKGRMLPYASRTMNVVLICLIRACRELAANAPTANGSNQTAPNVQLTLIRNIRHAGIKCLELVFSISPEMDWTRYIQPIFSEVISPRLDNLAVETAQGVSGLLQLFRVWASAPKPALYISGTPILPRVVDCLGVDSAKEEVKLYVLNEVLGSLVDLSLQKAVDHEGDVDISSSNAVRSKVLGPHLEYILIRLEALLRQQPSRTILGSAVELLSKLANLVDSSAETSKLISTTTFLLQQPPDRVPPKAKGRLLLVLQHFLPLYQPSDDPQLTNQIYEVLSGLFDYFKDDANRASLAVVFDIYAKFVPELTEVGKLIADLNSTSTTKLDEADFARRFAAFNSINEEKYSDFSPRQWRPLLHNLLYHVKDEEELSIRSSAALGIKRFIHKSGTCDASDADAYLELVEKVLLPSIKGGLKLSAETVRAEFVGLLGYFIETHAALDAVKDMRALLVEGDEEASFFNNILHIQQHRRSRALRRLATEAGKGDIQPINISSIFFPLVEHFVFNQAEEDENAHNLAAATITTIGSLSEALTWNQFKAIFRRYKGYLQTKPGLEKNVIRLLGQMTDALERAVSLKFGDQVVEDSMAVESVVQSALSKSLPSKTQLTGELKTTFIPFLTNFTSRRDEAEVTLRLPVAVTAVKLLTLLPEDDIALLLPSLLLDVTNILRSRAQDTRDVARKTLADITIILGPTYFGYILKELQTALSKGYQLHVLSYTVHSILVATSEHFKAGDLDPYLGTLSTIIMDDIFGTIGQQKDAEDYVSKMKEVKSSKSYDSMEHLSKNASLQHLYSLLKPVQMLLQEKLTSRLMRKIDELLRRIGIGLLHNPGVESRDFLVFCYEVIKESYKTPEPFQPTEQGRRQKDRFLIQLISIRKSGAGKSTSSYLYKLARFSLDVLRSVLNKYNSMLTADNLSGFVPIIGDAIVQGYEEVKLSAFRLLATIIKLPLPELDKNSDVYLVEAVKLLREASSTNTEASQAALKLISSILRERKNTKLKDSYLAYLLKRVAGDIEEPDRQGVTFNFIRAVMARKFIVPEMYELVDKVAAMMVTNHTRSARDLARGVYVHFLLEYPQARNRWTKQLAFLAQNLDYPHQDGKESVMEAIHLLLTKTNGEFAQDIVGTFFLPVVMVMANDESPSCREMAGALLGVIFTRADKDHLKTILTPIQSWLEQSDNLLLTSTGLQAIRIYFESDAENKEAQVAHTLSLLPEIMARSFREGDDNDWEILYYSEQLFTKLCKLSPATTISQNCSSIWHSIVKSLRYPHPWIKSCAANLVGLWFSNVAKTNATTGYGSVPLASSDGLILDDVSMFDIMRASMFCLRSPGVSEELATQSVRNMVFLGRCFGQNGLILPKKPDLAEPESDEDSSEDEEEDVEANENVAPPPEDSQNTEKSAIQYIFEQASRILRREISGTRADALTSKVVTMKLLAALCSHLEVEQITPSLDTILLPLLHLTDPSIPPPRSSNESFQAAYKSLVSSCHEILDLLQKKLGTTDFVTQIAGGREAMKSRRDDRRIKRKLEAVTDPEKFGRDKKRKHDRKREKRKERGLDHRSRRQGW
ncbi:U3 snoRNP protein [Myotisia sp. PD_48]|nr:U3 snoRNP protein [Myotisia sp. PD_48]